MSPAWRRLARSETDDPPAASTRRPGRPGTPHGDAEGLAHPAPLAALERVAAREPRDEPDPHVRLGPLLAGAGRPDVRAAPGRVRLRVLEVAGGSTSWSPAPATGERRAWAGPPAYTDHPMVLGFLSRFVDSNDREVRRVQPIVDAANALEPELEGEAESQIRARMDEIRAELAELQAGFGPTTDELEQDEPARRRDLEAERRTKETAQLQAALDDVLPEVLAAAREAMRRTLGMRHFDVQLMGAAVLHQGKIAEMRTGEGKTLIAPIAAVLNGLTGQGVHVVTPNDYLARRDAQWLGPIFHFLGVSVGIVVGEEAYRFEPGYPTTDERLINLRPCTRSEAYGADITYDTNNEFGFDYLRDNMVVELDQRVQRPHVYAIVDEVDSVLIDEARTPLIISGPVGNESDGAYAEFNAAVSRLVRGQTEKANDLVARGEKAFAAGDQAAAALAFYQAQLGNPKNKRL